MTQPTPANQQNSTAQRTVLLATDRSQSIIAETVECKTNTIGYSAYGDRSAQHEAATGLGFNGQLREKQTSWYLLGNGYRAYNPRLMRFHSPDSWSPFWGGGLNAYMYCVGDPVNRSDPTGHISIGKFLSRVFDFFSLNPQITGSNSSKALKATGAAGGLAGANGSGELGGLVSLGAGIGSRAPRPGGRSSTALGNSPAIGELGSTTQRHYRGYEGAARYGSNHRASRPASQNAGSRNIMRSSASGGDRPPTYEEAVPLWNADTFATSQKGRIYTVNRAAVQNRSYYDDLRPPPMEHPNPRPPTPPPPSSSSSSSSSSATSRDSTAPGSPRNRGGANNPPNFDDLATRLRFLRR